MFEHLNRLWKRIERTVSMNLCSTYQRYPSAPPPEFPSAQEPTFPSLEGPDPDIPSAPPPCFLHAVRPCRSRRLRAPGSRVRESGLRQPAARDRKSTRLNSSHRCISYAVFCLKK